MRKESKILQVPEVKAQDPLNDEHWSDGDDQLEALKELVRELQKNQKKPRKKKISE